MPALPYPAGIDVTEPRRLGVVIADDEPLARRTLRQLLRRAADTDVLAECRNGDEAIAAVQEHRPDLLFLDVQMPGLDGFDVLAALGRHAPAIVFVTAYDHYAIRAFEVHAIDYLLKPFTDERFTSALERARELVTAGAARRQPALDRLAEAHRVHTQRFMVRSAGRVVFLKASEIDWIEAADYYARLHVGGQSHLIRESMTALEAALDPELFVRVHRGAIVNLDRVREMRPLFKGEHVVVLTGGTELRLSRSRRADLEARFRSRR